MRHVQARQRVGELAVGRDERILVADIERDGAHRPERRHVLIDEDERRVGDPLRGNERLKLAVLRRQVEELRRVLRVGCPRRGLRRQRVGHTAAATLPGAWSGTAALGRAASCIAASGCVAATGCAAASGGRIVHQAA